MPVYVAIPATKSGGSDWDFKKNMASDIEVWTTCQTTCAFVGWSAIGFFFPRHDRKDISSIAGPKSF
jgi:hypothetical protein